MPVRPGPQQDTQHPKMTSLENSQQEQDEAGNKQRPVIEPHEDKSSEEPTELLPLKKEKMEEEQDHYENIDDIYEDIGDFFTPIKPSMTEKVNHERIIQSSKCPKTFVKQTCGIFMSKYLFTFHSKLFQWYSNSRKRHLR